MLTAFLLRFLLDTNIVIALFANGANVLQKLNAPSQIFLSSIVLGELYYGARKSVHTAQNIARVDNLAAHSTILVCDTETGRHYGDIKDKLRIKGKPLPENDIWIAALAQQYKLVLVTRDAHFQEVEGITVEAW